MKKRIFLMLMALTILALAITGCPGPTSPKTGSSEALLNSLTLDGTPVTLGAAISKADWDELSDLDDLTAAQIARFPITDEQDGEEATIAASASAGAKITYGTSSYGTSGTFNTPVTTKVTLDSGGYIVFKVTAGDGSTTNYYVVAVEKISNNTTLSTLQIADGAKLESIPGGSSSTTIAGVTLIDINVSNASKTNAAITYTFGVSFKGSAKFHKVAKTGSADEGDFTSLTAYPWDGTAKPSFTFADEDKLYVQMTAQDGETIKYYGFKVLIGWDATLKDLVFVNEYSVGSQTVREEASVDTLGTPKTTLTNFPATEEGKIQFKISQPPTGFKVEWVKNDPDQTVTISKDGTTFTAGTDKIIFGEGDKLYVKVISQNGQATNYYKISIALKRMVNIPYGTVTGALNAASPGAIWNTGATEWLYINRSNATEGTGWLDQAEADRSFGRAKLMWDEDGIWVYAEVWEKVVSTSGGEHTKSSVELFINEGYPTVTTGDVTSTNNGKGGQYRLGANGERTGSPTIPAVNTFNALGRYSAVKFTGTTPPADYPADERPANSINSGYKLIFQAPWLYTTTYPLANDKQVAIELQINATGADGTRVGVLNWNNISSNSYSSLDDYGGAVLKLGSNTLWSYPPTISTQPAGYKINVGGTLTALSVTATADAAGGGTLSYQWYQAASATDDGTAIASATADSYMPTVSTATAGEYYFYVVVTNTKDSKSISRKSAVVKVEVADPNTVSKTVELITSDLEGYDEDKGGWYHATGGTGYGNPQLSLTTPKDLADYVRMEVRYSIEGGIVPPTKNDNDLYFAIGGKGDVYNADGLLYEADGTTFAGLYLNLDAYSDVLSGGAIVLKFKPAQSEINKNKPILISSVKLIAGFLVDLSREATTGWPSDGMGRRVPAGYDEDSKKIVWVFPEIPAGSTGNSEANGNSARAAITFTDEQKAKLTNSSVNGVDIVIVGSHDVEGDGSWRVVTGNYGTGQNWGYAFGSWTTEPIASANGTKTSPSAITNQANSQDNMAFILFYGNGEDKTTATVTITRVEIQLRHADE